MFDSLRKKLKESVEKLTRKTESGKEEGRRSQTPSVESSTFKPQSTEERAETPKELPREEIPKEAESAEVPRPEPEPKMEKAEERRAPERHVKEHAPLPKEHKPEVHVKAPEPEKRGFLGRFREKVTTRALSDSDIEEFFSETEGGMLEANVALEVVDFLKQRLRENLAERQAKRFSAKNLVREAFEDSLYDVVNQGEVDLEGLITKARSEGRPACLIFLGFNGSGKTTSIAKLAHYLKGKGYTPVIAAADTFRAASIEQLEVHGEKTGVKVIKHQYGADSAAVVFDAVKFAKTKGYDVVLADTAGRSHADKNLMDELSKVVRVNRPDLRILVVDSLTGNDAVEQAKTFQAAAGVDAIVLTKIDVNKKGGAILSVCYAIKKPILFLGTGQDYENIEMFEPRKFVRELLE
jgi:fused signal recognition particle receptor